MEVSTKIPVVSLPPVRGGKASERNDLSGNMAMAEPYGHNDVTIGNDVSLSKLAEALDRYIPKDLPNTRLQIDQDQGSGQFVYKAVDQDSGEVVQQYTSEDILKFISYYREREGLLVDGTA